MAGWRDADYGLAWSRHVELAPLANIEFTFCEPSWAATDPIEVGTVNALSGGCRVLVDKANLFANLLTAALP